LVVLLERGRERGEWARWEWWEVERRVQWVWVELARNTFVHRIHCIYLHYHTIAVRHREDHCSSHTSNTSQFVVQMEQRRAREGGLLMLDVVTRWVLQK